MSKITPTAVSASTTYIGTPIPPNYTKPARIQFPLSANETISCEDRVHNILYKAKNATDTREMEDPKKFIAKYDEMITDHIERRVAVLFQQLVVCYKTKLHFEIGDTLHQGESAKAIVLQNHNGKKKKHSVRNAAHSSTLPNIIAYDSEGWKKYKEEGAKKPQGFMYIKGSDVYRTANSTLAMPREINEADIEIDGTSFAGDLRPQTIQLLNKCSQGVIDPIHGIQEFVEILLTETKKKVGHAKKAGVNTALEFFEAAIKDIKLELQDNETIYENMLGVQIDPSHTSAKIRKVICNLRYKAIRDSQYQQSKIIEKIESKAKEVLTLLGRKRKPNYYRDAFLDLLREQMPTDKDKLRIDKLFNTAHGYYLRDTNRRSTQFDKTKGLIREKALLAIQTLSREIQVEFRNTKREQILKRGLITHKLRSTLNLTQKELASKIKRVYPNTAASQPTISRIENNIKLIDPQYAKELAEVFNVDSALFMPSDFSD